MVLCGRDVVLRRERSLVWLTASNALDRSIDAATVRKGGLGWLKPVAILLTIGRRAVVVERLDLKPCWVSDKGRVLSWGRSSLSSTLAAGQRSEMGR